MIADRILRLPELKYRIGLSGSHIYAMVSKGTFPHQIKLGPRAAGWLESEVDQWIEQRIQDREDNR